MPGSGLAGEIFDWLGRSQQILVLLAVVLFLVSAIGVVYSAHMTRQLYGSMQVLQSDQDDLDSEYEKLLLEQSAWADYTRVDQLAREELNMTPPSPKDFVLVHSGRVGPGGDR
jgi:cell division protein FtsL